MEIVIVAGGRVGVVEDVIFHILDQIRPFLAPEIKIVHGGAKGIDTAAGAWAYSRKVNVESYRVDSKLDGFHRGAPRNRNIRMFRGANPNTLIAFPGGSGTRHATELGQAAKCRVLDVEIDSENNFVVWEWSYGSPAKKLIDGKYP